MQFNEPKGGKKRRRAERKASVYKDNIKILHKTIDKDKITRKI